MPIYGRKWALALLIASMPSLATAADDTTTNSYMPPDATQSEAQPPAAPTVRESNPSADNTAVNKRDTKAATADRAGNSARDRMLMKKIRQSVIADKSLSTNAHNVKIIARNGKITLKGPVKSSDESSTIEEKARGIAGDTNVVNQMTPKTDAPR